MSRFTDRLRVTMHAEYPTLRDAAYIIDKLELRLRQALEIARRNEGGDYVKLCQGTLDELERLR